MDKAKYKYIDHGICIDHNYLCAICREKSAVLEMWSGILQPCWDCQKHYKIFKINWLTKFFMYWISTK